MRGAAITFILFQVLLIVIWNFQDNKRLSLIPQEADMLICSAIFIKIVLDTTAYSMLIGSVKIIKQKYALNNPGSNVDRIFGFIYLFIIQQIIDQCQIILMRLLVTSFVKERFLSEYQTAQMIIFEYNIVDPFEKFILFVTFGILIKF